MRLTRRWGRPNPTPVRLPLPTPIRPSLASATAVSAHSHLPSDDAGLHHVHVVTGTRRPGLAALRAERDALTADKARLEDTVRTQDALLTVAAHDLKNSLAAIIMRADLLQDQMDDDVQAGEGSLPVHEGLARIHATSSNMARLLDELLGLARVQSGHAWTSCANPWTWSR